MSTLRELAARTPGGEARFRPRPGGEHLLRRALGRGRLELDRSGRDRHRARRTASRRDRPARVDSTGGALQGRPRSARGPGGPRSGRLRRHGGRYRRQLATGRSGSSVCVEPAVEQVVQVGAGPRRAAKARKSRSSPIPPWCSATQSCSSAKNALVADRRAQGVQGQRAALVDPVVEHQLRARVGEHQVLVELGEPLVVVLRPTGRRCRRRTPPTTATRRSRRSPRAARCPASARRVTALPNHWWASSWATSRTASQSSRQKLRPNVDRACDSSGISRSSAVTTDGVAGERVGAEQLDEERHHLRLPAERGLEPVARRRRRDHRSGIGTTGRVDRRVVAADLHGGEVGRHRLVLLVDPGHSATRRGVGARRARRWRRRGSPAAAVTVIGTSPCRRAGRCRGTRSAHRAAGRRRSRRRSSSSQPASPRCSVDQRRRAAGVLDHARGTSSPGGDRAREVDHEPVAAAAVPGRRPTVDASPSRRRGRARSSTTRVRSSSAHAASMRRLAVEPVAGEVVVEVEVVVRGTSYDGSPWPGR